MVLYYCLSSDAQFSRTLLGVRDLGCSHPPFDEIALGLRSFVRSCRQIPPGVSLHKVLLKTLPFGGHSPDRSSMLCTIGLHLVPSSSNLRRTCSFPKCFPLSPTKKSPVAILLRGADRSQQSRSPKRENVSPRKSSSTAPVAAFVLAAARKATAFTRRASSSASSPPLSVEQRQQAFSKGLIGSVWFDTD